MSRKDYVLIAENLKADRPVVGNVDPNADVLRVHGWQIAVDSIAHAFASDNSRFDRDRFMAAAGFSDNG